MMWLLQHSDIVAAEKDSAYSEMVLSSVCFTSGAFVPPQ